MTSSKLTPEAVREQLNLDETPTAEFMALLEEAMASSEVPVVPSGTIDTTVDELLEICISGSVGHLLARAREQEGKALEAVGAAAGVTRARIQQIENSTNLELATLVKVASALGYRVGIRLEPVDRTRAALVTELPSRVGSSRYPCDEPVVARGEALSGGQRKRPAEQGEGGSGGG